MNLESWKARARILKRETYTLYLCARHPGTPLYAKVFALVVVTYALSPIDLIPDFIPVLGYLDDLILIPLGISLLIRMVPEKVLNECRLKAEGHKPRRSWMGALVIILIWLCAALIALRILLSMMHR